MTLNFGSNRIIDTRVILKVGGVDQITMIEDKVGKPRITADLCDWRGRPSVKIIDNQVTSYVKNAFQVIHEQSGFKILRASDKTVFFHLIESGEAVDIPEADFYTYNKVRIIVDKATGNVKADNFEVGNCTFTSLGAAFVID